MVPNGITTKHVGRSAAVSAGVPVGDAAGSLVSDAAIRAMLRALRRGRDRPARPIGSAGRAGELGVGNRVAAEGVLSNTPGRGAAGANERGIP